MFAFCPDWRMALDFVGRFAQRGQPLDEQARFISTPENLRQVAGLIVNRKGITPADLEKLPVCDSAGRLRFGLLASADEETHALVAGQPVFAKLVHPVFNGFEASGHGKISKPMETRKILESVLVGKILAVPEKRLRFYNWLVSHEHKVMSEDACRELIETRSCFMNAAGKLVVPGDLVVDPDLPALGIDWAPHPDTPKAVLTLLTRQLKMGKPPIEKLIKSHIRAAYDAAASAADSDRAREMLIYLAKQLGSRSQNEVRELLPDILLEDARGDFRPATELLQPIASVAEYVKNI